MWYLKGPRPTRPKPCSRLLSLPVFLLTCCTIGCGKPPVSYTDYPLASQQQIELRHNYRSAEPGGWDLEGWTEGSRCRPSPTIPIFLRLTQRGKEATLPPKAVVLMQWKKAGDDTILNEASFNTEFQKVKRETLTVWDDDARGIIERKVLNPGDGWEQSITYRPGFRNDHGNKAFAEQYYLFIEVKLENGEPLRLREIAITVGLP